MSLLSGYRTYIISILMVLVGGAYQQGYLSEPLFKALEAVLLGGGLAALRAGVAAKNGK